MSLQFSSDLELLAQIKADNEAAFDEIFKRYWKSLVDESFLRLKDLIQCEEVVQEVFYTLWDRRSTAVINNLSAWLKAAVKNQIFLLYKREKRIAAFEEPVKQMAVAVLQPDSIFFAKELQSAINCWLELQPERRQQIFRLRYVDDLTPKEIAQMLSISQSTVHNTLHVATLNLKSTLGKLAFILLFSQTL